MSLSWLKEIQQVPIKKTLLLTGNLMYQKMPWTPDSLPKRTELLEEFTQLRERMLIRRIVVCDKSHDKSLILRVAVMKDCLNLNDSSHLEKFKKILCNIKLEKIHVIDSEYSDYCRQTSTSFASLKNTSSTKISNDDRVELHAIKKFGYDEIDRIVAHLNGASKDDITENEIEKVDSFIEHGFNLYPELPSYAELLKTHNLTTEWFRKENPEINDETFPIVLKNSIDAIFQENDEIKENSLSSYWYVAAHALCECNRTKKAQQVKEPHQKKERAFREWKSSYQGKTKKERKVSGTSLRSIATKVGISVGTLSNWIKEFERFGKN